MALQRANTVRLARAALKRAIHDGHCDVVDVVASCPSEAESMSVGELLVAQHRWGEARALRLLRRIPLSEGKPIGSLTARQRRTLIEFLGGTASAADGPSPLPSAPLASVPAVLLRGAATPGTTVHRSAGGTPGATP